MMPDILHGSRALSARRQAVLDYVTAHGCVLIQDLLVQFTMTRAAMNRDLHALATQGLIRKVGESVTTLSNAVAASSIMLRARQAVQEKLGITAIAAGLIEEGDTIALDDSTTSRFLSERLTAIGQLTVVTNSLGISTKIGRSRDISLIALGGRYNPTFDAFLGVLCERSVTSLRINTLFMSTSAIHGLSAYHQDEDLIKAKSALMNMADRRVLMVDSRKFGISALNHLANLTDFDAVITDSGLSGEIADRMMGAGVKLHIADIPSAEIPMAMMA
ncbi:DeoR/GlpR transcriptional regulator [Gluconobacter cerinus]|uniref:DeoR/GlpR family DNA-binding transcription regulator n=1 Tax=Gluconobacter TaxID=441 RepID=UPI001B8AAAF1|nr:MULTISPECIES: DeoR/GlpR family DNA-binding transcription regulator [Gluconobacter]MBS0993559.1 DeoR/GlpR transcriptional regulator [Gluconobacter cerinus]MBS1021203.1 DeoR/GlpR transcriptional regulator [Gluconobacter cerinus]MBS1038379.1 DeoR/GlpR transcriptional regulator [Gluconobacter cerinus]